ncbi:MAG: MBL fold metallo-hydrolase [Candidatus Omnitrophica bacterium]|nr:MBL fold metallo-hydrolase [Candidatus Omnitrophota bacterium]
MMRFVILGAGTAIPATAHSPAGIYVHIGREHVLLDAGAGTLQRLQAAGLPWHQLDRVFLTHYHLDHCLDLASILFALRLPDVGRRKPLMVYGPPGLTRLYRQLNTAFHGWIAPRGFRLILKEVSQTTVRLPGYAVQTRRMRHDDTGAVGYRLTGQGRSLAYSGDTDVCEEVVELGRHADAFILECSVPDERKAAGHLTPSECGRLAAAARCRHLILTHFYPVFQGDDIRGRVRRAYQGRLTLARDFTRVIL